MVFFQESIYFSEKLPTHFICDCENDFYPGDNKM